MMITQNLIDLKLNLLYGGVGSTILLLNIEKGYKAVEIVRKFFKQNKEPEDNEKK